MSFDAMERQERASTPETYGEPESFFASFLCGARKKGRKEQGNANQVLLAVASSGQVLREAEGDLVYVVSRVSVPKITGGKAHLFLSSNLYTKYMKTKQTQEKIGKPA